MDGIRFVNPGDAKRYTFGRVASWPYPLPWRQRLWLWLNRRKRIVITSVSFEDGTITMTSEVRK